MQFRLPGQELSCGATQLDGNIRPLCVPCQHTAAQLTDRLPVSHRPQRGFRSPSEVHSLIIRVPHSHHLQLSVTFRDKLLTLHQRFDI